MGEDDIESKPFSLEDSVNFKQNTHCSEHDSSDDVIISELITENIVILNYKKLVSEGLLNERTQDKVIES